jgi:hypothetical protein
MLLKVIAISAHSFLLCNFNCFFFTLHCKLLPHSSPLFSISSLLCHFFSPLLLLPTPLFLICRIEAKVADTTEKENDVNWNLLEPTSVTSLNDAAYGMFFCSSSTEPSVEYSLFNVLRSHCFYMTLLIC